MFSCAWHLPIQEPRKSFARLASSACLQVPGASHKKQRRHQMERIRPMPQRRSQQSMHSTKRTRTPRQKRLRWEECELGTLEVLDIQVSILSIQVHFAHIVQFIHIIIPGVHTGLITAHGFTHDVNVYGEMPSHALAAAWLFSPECVA